MPQLTPQQIEIREEVIKAMSEQTSKKPPCSCCGRSYDQTEEIEAMATRNNRALNALIAALYPAGGNPTP